MLWGFDWNLNFLEILSFSVAAAFSKWNLKQSLVVGKWPLETGVWGGVTPSDSKVTHIRPLYCPQITWQTPGVIFRTMSVVLSGGKRRIIVQEVQKYRILREIIVYRIIGRYLLLLSPAVYFACPPPPPPPSPGFLISPCFFLAPPLFVPFFSRSSPSISWGGCSGPFSQSWSLLWCKDLNVTRNSHLGKYN